MATVQYKEDVIRNRDLVPTCPICLNMIKIPHMTDCGHVCCLECFRRAGLELLNLDPLPKCPYCRSPVRYLHKMHDPLLRPRHELLSE